MPKNQDDTRSYDFQSEVGHFFPGFHRVLYRKLDSANLENPSENVVISDRVGRHEVTPERRRRRAGGLQTFAPPRGTQRGRRH
jgi:hypothetical protein